MYYVCLICENIAFEKWNQLRAHFMGKHRDMKDNWPTREDSEFEELPEGVRLVKAPQKKVLLAEEEKPAVGIRPEELSSDAKHLHDLLLLHGVKPATVDIIVNLYDKLDLYKDPRNLANLLRQRLDKKEQYAIVPVLFEMYPERKEELPYIMPYSEAASPWITQGQAGYPYYPSRAGVPPIGYPPYAPTPAYPGYPPAGGESSLDRFIEYQMTKDIREEKGERGGRVSPEVESRLNRIETALERMIDEKQSEEKESRAVSSVRGEITELKSAIGKLAEEKDKQALVQPLMDRIEFMEKAHKEEMNRLTSEIETRKGKGEETDWLQHYMEERDKRHEDETARYREDMKKLTEEVTKSREKEGDSYRKAWQDFTADRDKIEQAREKAREQLIKSGYSLREKDFEERVLDIVEDQAAPAFIGEVREGRKTLQDIAKRMGAGGETGAGRGEEEAAPITEQDADKMAEVLELEEEMREISKGRP